MNRKLLARLICTFFYIGEIPIPLCRGKGQGTLASLITMVIILFLVPSYFYILVVISMVLFLVSVWSATVGEKIFDKKDSSYIVIDEVTGMVLSLILVPFGIKSYVGAFLLFRIFDIIKPPPARRVQCLKGGWGVTLDDVIAGIYANLSLHVISFLVNFI